MKNKKLRLILSIIALMPASIVIVSGVLSFFLLFIFPTLVNLVASISWTSLGLVYVLFAIDTLKLYRKK
ncbi:MAG: hypothetical protein EBU90_06535 [Proteobacteria bacterium]|nr:hypothetical protein [Pseudomonadota bacterium]